MDEQILGYALLAAKRYGLCEGSMSLFRKDIMHVVKEYSGTQAALAYYEGIFPEKIENTRGIASKIVLGCGSSFSRTDETAICQETGTDLPLFRDEMGRTILLYDCGDWFSGVTSFQEMSIFFTVESEYAVGSGDSDTLVEEV